MAQYSQMSLSSKPEKVWSPLLVQVRQEAAHRWLAGLWSLFRNVLFPVTEEHLHGPQADQVLTKKRQDTCTVIHLLNRNQQPHLEYEAGFSNYLNFCWERVWSGMRSVPHLETPLFMPKCPFHSEAPPRSLGSSLDPEKAPFLPQARRMALWN